MAKFGDNTTPDLGLFFGDQGGPGTALPQTDAQKMCPFLDQQQGAFCSLDGAMCPFVGFNYRKCKKYMNNLTKGVFASTNPTGIVPKTKPPRLEALTEGKKGGRIQALLEAKGGAKKPSEKKAAAPPKKKTTPPKKKNGSTVDTEKELNDFLSGKAQAIEVGSSRKGGGKKTAPAPEPSAPDRGDPLPPLPVRQQRALPVANQIALNAVLALQNKDVQSKEAQQTFADSFETFVNIKAAMPPPPASWSARQATVDKQHQELRNLQAHIDAYLRRSLGLKIEGGTKTDYRHVTDAMFDAMHQYIDMGEFRDWRTRDVDLKNAPDSGLERDLSEPRGGSQGTEPVGASAHAAPGVGPHDAGSAEQSAAGAPPPPPGSKTAAQQVVTDVGHRIQMDTDAETSSTGTTGTSKRTKHPSGFSQAAGDTRNYEQTVGRIEAEFNSLTPEEKRTFYRGDGELNSPEKLIAKAKQLWAVNDTSGLETLTRELTNRVRDIRKVAQARAEFDLAWDNNIEFLKRNHLVDDGTLKMLRTDPARTGKIADMMNRARKKLYTVETQNMSLGDKKITKLVRQATLPVLDRTDYEVMRMSEQLGLAAIQKQHTYGRDYGKFNTWNLLVKQVLAPIALLWTGHAGYVRPLLHIWPQQFLDSLYFAYLQSPLPKLRGSSMPQLSRDTKFELSQKMSTPSQQDRLMKGFYTDPPGLKGFDSAGVVMPPDTAILHNRMYPTTKESWPKRRKNVLAQRYQEVKARLANPADDWRRGYLRGH